jgi:hypothetical protein
MDDSDVALLHAPQELDYAALTVPLVNLRATLRYLSEQATLSVADAVDIEAAAASLFYKERTWSALLSRARVPLGADAAMLRDNYVDQKRIDALELLEALRRMPTERHSPPQDWKFNATSLWTKLLGQLPPSDKKAGA